MDQQSIMRQYLDIVNESKNEILDEGAMQKLASAALAAVLALGPAAAAKADLIYSYLDPASQTMKTTYQKSQIPADAKVAFSVDTDTNTTTILKGPSDKEQSVAPNSEFDKLIDIAKNAALKQMFDPQSAQFDDIKVYDTKDRKGNSIYVVFGRVNAKNRMGGYAGYVDFGVSLSKESNIPIKIAMDRGTNKELEVMANWAEMVFGKAMANGTLVYANGKAILPKSNDQIEQGIKQGVLSTEEVNELINIANANKAEDIKIYDTQISKDSKLHDVFIVTFAVRLWSPGATTARLWGVDQNLVQPKLLGGVAIDKSTKKVLRRPNPLTGVNSGDFGKAIEAGTLVYSKE